MDTRDGLHQMASGMIAKVRGDVTDPQSAVRREGLAELVGRLVEHLDLLQTQLRVAVGDGLPEVMRKRIEHRVVRMDRGQAVLLELIGDDGYQGLLAGRVVRPVTNNLEREMGLSRELTCFKSFPLVWT